MDDFLCCGVLSCSLVIGRSTKENKRKMKEWILKLIWFSLINMFKIYFKKMCVLFFNFFLIIIKRKGGDRVSCVRPTPKHVATRGSVWTLFFFFFFLPNPPARQLLTSQNALHRFSKITKMPLRVTRVLSSSHKARDGMFFVRIW